LPAKVVNDDAFYQDNVARLSPSLASQLLQGTVFPEVAFAFDLAVAPASDLDLLPLSQRPMAAGPRSNVLVAETDMPPSHLNFVLSEQNAKVCCLFISHGPESSAPKH
jgi:hypothetical protein